MSGGDNDGDSLKFEFGAPDAVTGPPDAKHSRERDERIEEVTPMFRPLSITQ